MGKLIMKIALILFCGLLFGAAGLIFGAYVGGNFFVEFTFNGVRGYEATGQIGLFAGLVIGSAFGIVLTSTHSKQKT